MSEVKQSYVGGGLSACIAVSGMFASDFVPQWLAGFLFISGVAGLCYFAFQIAWQKFDLSSKGSLPRILFYFGIAAAILMIFSLSKHVIEEIVGGPAAASLSPPVPVQQAAKPAPVPLKYQICGKFLMDPVTRKLSSFEFEIDPINPNADKVAYKYKRWFVLFGGKPGTVDAGEGLTMELAPQSEIVAGKSRIPATRVAVNFDPPIIAPRLMTGKYLFQVQYGPDEDNMNLTADISGSIAGTFDPDGMPTDVKFTPSGGKNINFDPMPCDVDL